MRTLYALTLTKISLNDQDKFLCLCVARSTRTLGRKRTGLLFLNILGFYNISYLDDAFLYKKDKNTC